MARRSEHSQEQIKKMVLEASEEIVQEQGFSALKVRRIAADIGYTVGSIYMVFANMNDLNMHIKGRTWQKLTIYLNRQLQQTPVNVETINECAINYLEFAMRNEGLWRMLFEHQLPVGEPVPDWYKHESDCVIEFFYQLLTQLDPHQSKKYVWQSAEVLVASIQGVCMRLIMLSKSHSAGNIDIKKQSIILLVTYFIQGWSKEAKKNESN